MFLRLILVFIFLSLSAHAQSLREPLASTVSDFADLLPPEVEARVVDALTKGRQETGVHVALVTMERIADYGGAGQRIEDYAKTLFNTWGVGDAGRNDGILILVARSDREMRIALGAGYSVIWDNVAQRVIDRYFLPEFRADRYAAGIEAGVQGTIDLIARPYAANSPPPEPEPEGTTTDIIQMIMTGLLVVGVGFVAFRKHVGRVVARLRRCPHCGHRGLDQSRHILDQPTQTTTGRGEIHRSCPSCGKRTIIPYKIATKSASSGGFGGGSSSGGGATGRW